jgi:hypothetical protein
MVGVAKSKNNNYHYYLTRLQYYKKDLIIKQKKLFQII